MDADVLKPLQSFYLPIFASAPSWTRTHELQGKGDLPILTLLCLGSVSGSRSTQRRTDSITAKYLSSSVRQVCPVFVCIDREPVTGVSGWVSDRHGPVFVVALWLCFVKGLILLIRSLKPISQLMIGTNGLRSSSSRRSVRD